MRHALKDTTTTIAMVPTADSNVTILHNAKPLSRMSKAELADAIGAADLEAKAAAIELGKLKDEAKRRGLEAAAGERFEITITTSEQTRIDSKKVRNKYKGAALRALESTTEIETLRVKPIAAAFAAILSAR